MLVACVLLALLSSAQTKSNNEGMVKDKYHVIQVETFDIQPGMDIPPDYLATLPQQVAKQLKDSRNFQEVLAPGERPSQEDAPALRLSGTLTGYDQGSRGKRYIGFGMGEARLFLTLRYLDRSSGQTVYNDKVVGTLEGGIFGGNENKVVEELAKRVAATTKLVLLRRLGDANNVMEEPPTCGTKEAEADRQVLDIKGDLTIAEDKMNELAAQGYRLSDLKVTGNQSAQATMEKCASPPQTYHYVLVHALMAGHVEKNMNRAAGEGYRLARHTLAALGAFAVIMEKPPFPGDTRYEYRFSTSMRQSNAEKHLMEDQQKGFVLVETAQVLGQNVVITEKANPVREPKR